MLKDYIRDYYTQDEVIRIINDNEELKEKLEELKPYYDDFDLDHGFRYGNFFNEYDEKNDKVLSTIVIQWLSDDDDLEDAQEVIVDTLEKAVVVLKDIENSKGEIRA